MQSCLHIAGNTQNCSGRQLLGQLRKKPVQVVIVIGLVYLDAVYFSPALIMILTKMCKLSFHLPVSIDSSVLLMAFLVDF